MLWQGRVQALERQRRAVRPRLSAAAANCPSGSHTAAATILERGRTVQRYMAQVVPQVMNTGTYRPKPTNLDVGTYLLQGGDVGNIHRRCPPTCRLSSFNTRFRLPRHVHRLGKRTDIALLLPSLNFTPSPAEINAWTVNVRLLIYSILGRRVRPSGCSPRAPFWNRSRASGLWTVM